LDAFQKHRLRRLRFSELCGLSQDPCAQAHDPFAVLSLCSVAIITVDASAGVAVEAATQPMCSSTGPDAAVYGATDGFLPVTRGTTGEVGNFVASYSHFAELFAPRPYHKRATEPKISYTFSSERFSIGDYLSRNATPTSQLVTYSRSPKAVTSAHKR
jgi:hypothetical protein